MKMNKNTLDKVIVSRRLTLYYRPLKTVRENGVSGELVGYKKNGKIFWYE